jgi:hypothetical protein
MAITDIPNYQERLDSTNEQVKKLLVDSDYTQIVDAPFTAEQKQSWATYRQALRDLSKDEKYPFVQLPTPPQE